MKLQKEQITFIVVILLVGWLTFSAISDGKSGKKARKSRGSGRVQQHDLSTLPAAFLALDEESWQIAGRNIYHAPSEHSPLPPLSLEVPPRPPLPVSSPQPLPGIDAFHRTRLVAAIDAVEGIVLPPREERVEDTAVDEEDEEDQDQTAPPTQPVVKEIDDKAKKDRTVKKILGMRERLAKKAREKVEEARAELEREQETVARHRTLDKIHWAGETWHGEILNDAVRKPGSPGFDRYEIKLKIDQIRADTELSTTQREDALRDRELEIEFRRWKDREKKFDRKQKLSPVNIQSLEFAEGAVNEFEIAKRTTPPEDAAAHLAMSRKLMDAGEYRLAKEHLSWMLTKGHTLRDVYVALADAAQHDFDFDVEMKALDEGLEHSREDAALLASLGEVYSRLGVYNLANDTFDRAVQLSPRSARVNSRYGAYVLEHAPRLRGTSARALQHLQRAAAMRMEDRAEKARLMINLAAAHLAAGDISNAAQAYADVNSADPANIAGILGLGSVAFARGDFDGAKTRYNEALERNPENGRAYYDLGLCALAQKDWRAARDAFYDAMFVDPLLSARARCALGYLYEKLGQAGEAQIHYAAAYEVDPVDPEVLMWYGRGFLLIGDYPKALESLQAALVKMPEQFDVLAALADATFNLQRYADSLRFIDKALALYGGSSTLMVRRAQTLSRLRRFDEAKAALDQAKQKEASNEVELSLAYHYYVGGNHEEALKRFRRVERELDRKDESAIAEYARSYSEEISENLAKQVWTDHFNRVSTGRDLLRGWKSYAPASGVSVNLIGNQVSFAGKQKKSEVPSCIFQQRNGRLFVSFEASFLAPRAGEFTTGVGIFSFRKNTGEQNPFVDMFSNGIVYEGLIVAKTPEGRLAWRRITRYEMGRWQAIDEEVWPANNSGDPRPMQIGIAVADAKKGTFDILVNGGVAVAGVDGKGLQRSNKDLQLWAFTQAEIDKRVEVKVDDVRIVTRKTARKR